MTRTNDPITVAGTTVEPGQREDVACVVSESYTGDTTTIPIAVINGVEPGPRVFVTAAIHGDELNGTAACQRVIDLVEPEGLHGSLIVVPIVNVLGAQIHSRYLPDRRDLNRSFPGSNSGSIAARMARIVFDEVVTGSDVGVDLHTAANRRTNVPQIRVVADDQRAQELAVAFGAPFALAASIRPGSLRHIAHEHGIPVLTFEGGEPLRFDDESIEVATLGILRLLSHLDMRDAGPPPPSQPPVYMNESKWLRADRGGIIDMQVEPGDHVVEGQPLWTTTSPTGAERRAMESPVEGVVIGGTTLPLVSPGDAVLHLGIPGDRPPFEDDPSEEEDAVSTRH